jgi:hypothetical protein
MAGRASLPRLPARQVAAVLRVWVVAAVSTPAAAVAVSMSAAALRDLDLVPAAAHPGLGLAVAALLRHSSAVAVRLARGSAVAAAAADMVAATAVTIIVAAAASFPARWPVL